MSNINIAVVLVTFNRSNMLKENLHSLKSQGNLTFYIIDNNSVDDTKDVVDTFKESVDHDVNYFNTGANLGGAGGFAFGCEKVLVSTKKYTHVWLADDDVTFSENCLNELLIYDDGRTILQPMRYAVDGSNAEASATQIDLETICILNHKRNSVMGSEFENAVYPFDIQNIPFEGPLIPITILKKVGTPDNRYFIFSDDLDFSLKALNCGFNIKCVPSAKMTRLRLAEPNYKPTDWKSYFVYRNFFRIQKKFGKNMIVRNRPYFLAILVIIYCVLTGNFRGALIVKDALRDGMSPKFNLCEKYIP